MGLKVIVEYGAYKLKETANMEYYWELSNYSSQYFKTVDEALNCPAMDIEWRHDN